MEPAVLSPLQNSYPLLCREEEQGLLVRLGQPANRMPAPQRRLAAIAEQLCACTATPAATPAPATTPAPAAAASPATPRLEDEEYEEGAAVEMSEREKFLLDLHGFLVVEVRCPHSACTAPMCALCITEPS